MIEYNINMYQSDYHLWRYFALIISFMLSQKKLKITSNKNWPIVNVSTISFCINKNTIHIFYSVASILVNPIEPIITVCPQPQNKAYSGFIGKLDAL